jgi:hypothetical protein
MGIIDIASSKSVWRGIDYYKQKKVLSCEENEDGTYFVDEKIVRKKEGYAWEKRKKRN